LGAKNLENKEYKILFVPQRRNASEKLINPTAYRLSFNLFYMGTDKLSNINTLMIKNVMNQIYNQEKLDPERSTMNPLWMYDEENEDKKKEELLRSLFP